MAEFPPTAFYFATIEQKPTPAPTTEPEPTPAPTPAAQLRLIEKLRTYSKQTPAQQLLLILVDKKERNAEDKRKLSVLIRAELAEEKADAARQNVKNLLRNDEKKRSTEERKARNHRLIKLGALVDVAGLEDKSAGEILGLLLSGNGFDAEKWMALKVAGDVLLVEREALNGVLNETAKVVKE